MNNYIYWLSVSQIIWCVMNGMMKCADLPSWHGSSSSIFLEFVDSATYWLIFHITSILKPQVCYYVSGVLIFVFSWTKEKTKHFSFRKSFFFFFLNVIHDMLMEGLRLWKDLLYSVIELLSFCKHDFSSSFFRSINSCTFKLLRSTCLLYLAAPLVALSVFVPRLYWWHFITELLHQFGRRDVPICLSKLLWKLKQWGVMSGIIIEYIYMKNQTKESRKKYKYDKLLD